jgi:hypothetical protein
MFAESATPERKRASSSHTRRRSGAKHPGSKERVNEHSEVHMKDGTSAFLPMPLVADRPILEALHNRRLSSLRGTREPLRSIW